MLVFLGLLFCYIYRVTNSLSCLDDDGQEIDWFVGYKLPFGYDVVFMNPDQRNWELSKYPINDSGMMKNTFESMFKLINKPDSVIGMYNDEIPNVTNPSVTQFTLARPLFQSAYISPSVKLKFPDLAKLLENTKVPTESQNNVVELQTANKALQLKHFSKSSDFGKDLYADFVAPTLKKSLDTETWQHDGSLPSACHRQYSVKNIKSIYIEVSKTTITNPHDHAKWAVTVSSNDLVEDTNNWVCLGDINRQPHQFYRGGGTMCIMNQQLWQSFYTTIQSVEECGKIIAIVKYLFKQLSFVIEIVQYVFIMYA
ncbi:Cell death-related nuclease 6 [Schistosoma japonicum]|nr:Cell death-related nuclease 6 [Schistosoma japonicum]